MIEVFHMKIIEKSRCSIAMFEYRRISNISIDFHIPIDIWKWWKSINILISSKIFQSLHSAAFESVSQDRGLRQHPLIVDQLLVRTPVNIPKKKRKQKNKKNQFHMVSPWFPHLNFMLYIAGWSISLPDEFLQRWSATRSASVIDLPAVHTWILAVSHGQNT